MKRRSASGTVLLTTGLMAVALSAVPSDARAQFGNYFFPDEFFGGPNGDFPMPDGYGSGYYYDGPFNGGLTWSPWGDDEEEDVVGEALFDMYMGYGPWGNPDDPDAYDGGDEDDDDDDPWEGAPDFDGPRDGGRASEQRAVGVQVSTRSQARDAEEATQIMSIIRLLGR